MRGSRLAHVYILRKHVAQDFYDVGISNIFAQLHD